MMIRSLLVQLFVWYFVFGTILGDDCATLPDMETLEKCCDSPSLIMAEYAKACENDDATSTLWKWSECYFKSMGAIVGDQPSAAELKKKSKQILANHTAWDAAIFNAAVDKCVPEVIAKDADTRKRVSEPPFNMKNAITKYAHVIECVDIELLLKCPASVRLDSSKCNAVIDYVKKCSKDFPPHYVILDEL